MTPHPLTNFIQKYYQNESKFNGIFSRNNLPKIKDGVYVINLKEYKSIGAHWVIIIIIIIIIIIAIFTFIYNRKRTFFQVIFTYYYINILFIPGQLYMLMVIM